MVALESLGLGGCFIGGLRNGIAKADQALGLPENVYPVLGLAFGHPAFKNEVKPRLPQAITVMENRYIKPDAAELQKYVPSPKRISLHAAVRRARTPGQKASEACLPANADRLFWSSFAPKVLQNDKKRQGRRLLKISRYT